MAEVNEKKYLKLLVSRFSPANECFVEEGGILLVIPRPTVPVKDSISHFFVDSVDQKTKSKYGWVTAVEPFTARDFLSRYLKGDCSDACIKHNVTMLDSISKLEVDTPVAATYSQRGLDYKTMVFTVHKVFFYKPKW